MEERADLSVGRSRYSSCTATRCSRQLKYSSLHEGDKSRVSPNQQPHSDCAEGKVVLEDLLVVGYPLVQLIVGIFQCPMGAGSGGP